MTADEYQTAAARTLIDKPDAEYTATDLMLVWVAIGLAGESGELVDCVKKAVFHQHGVDRDKLIDELGDVLWYAAAMATQVGASLSEVMARNIAKLERRYPDGYSSEASRNRSG